MTIQEMLERNLNEYGIHSSIYENPGYRYYYVSRKLFLNQEFKQGILDLFLIIGCEYSYFVVLSDHQDRLFISCRLLES